MSADKPDPSDAALVHLCDARQAIEKARTVDEVSKIRDTAAAAVIYAKARKMGLEIQNDAAEIVLRSERRIGEILAEMPLRGGDRRPDSKGQRVRLKDLGIASHESKRWQKVASIPVERFEHHLAEVRSRGGEITQAGLLHVAQRDKRERLWKEMDRARAEGKYPIPEGRFDVIVADPAWPITFAPSLRNAPEALQQICHTPVPDRSADDCTLWLWCVNSFMEEAYQVAKAWGFKPRTLLTWHKGNAGMGSPLHNVTEHVILATKGKPRFRGTRASGGDHIAGTWDGRVLQPFHPTTLIFEEKRESQRKPEAFYWLVETLCPGTRLELNARQRRTGWESQGDQLDMFGWAFDPIYDQWDDIPIPEPPPGDLDEDDPEPSPSARRIAGLDDPHDPDWPARRRPK